MEDPIRELEQYYAMHKYTYSFDVKFYLKISSKWKIHWKVLHSSACGSDLHPEESVPRF